MYDPGDILYVRSNILSSSDVTQHDPAGLLATWNSPYGRALTSIADKDVPLQPLIYQLRILQAYKPFTMSVVCRVRLCGVFASPAALAPFVPLPSEMTSTASNGSEAPSAERFDLDLDQQCSGPEFVLKLYDHRCFVNIREQCDQGRPYSEDKARAYHIYRQGPPAPYYADTFRDMPGKSGQDHWTERDAALFEAWMEVDANRTYEREVSIYKLLGDLQGCSIPFLYDTVTCNTRFLFPRVSSSPAGSHDAKTAVGEALDDVRREHVIHPADLPGEPLFEDWRRVSGILLEFVPGTSLRSFVHACLKSDGNLKGALATVAEGAVALVLRMDRYPMINRDIRLDNILVRETHLATLGLSGPDTKSNAVSSGTKTEDSANPSVPSPCVAIDFGQVRLRYPDETEEQWRCAKFYENEEGAIVNGLQWEIRQVLKDFFYCGNMPDSTEGRAALQTVCRLEQEMIWSYEAQQPWYRELSPEEEEELMSDPTWGQHPGNWSAKGFLP